MFKVKIRTQIRTLSGEANNSKYKLERNRFHENKQGCVCVKLNMASWNSLNLMMLK